MTQLSSALYKLVNSRLATKRKPWNPEDSVRILCDSPWKKGDELFDWYSHRTDSIIETMQLRKEHESPFFHEYVTFSLRDNAGCFRVDRHQGPNETQPLAAVYNGGVQAYDTINSIRSLDDRHYGRSDCLIEITFRDDASVPLLLLLKICRTIAQHQSARIYTVQRYSCTFYSQAIILCTLQQVFVETVQSHARGLIHSEIAIDSDVLNQEFGRSMPPTDLPNLSHQNYPAIDFVTREDECSACWKSALVRRTVGGSNDVFSLDNLSGLFWDGVVRVAEHFIQLLDVTTGSRDGSWFLCPRFYLVELCQQLTYQAVYDTWDTRLRLFERNFVSYGEMTPRCTCPYREPGVSSGIETTTVEHSAHDALVFTDNICSPGQVDLKTRHPEIAKFFRTNINDVQQEFRNKARTEHIIEGQLWHPKRHMGRFSKLARRMRFYVTCSALIIKP
ncbi:unnamed protein product [Rhizoctonia solani]|uniref:Uncharacterized protein n=1 Tax=Rhizoctonia solani TaxID=456999 RepID=A0A8H3HSC5_9AGAM|nr:unnamed protein product [Rhizoctonia solani]